MTTLPTTTETKIEEFFNSLDLDIDFNACLDYVELGEDVDSGDELTYEYIDDILSNQGAIDVEILYYGSAMEYLSENDASLNESLEIAHEMGYEVQNINSELLASLLATRELQDEWSDKQEEVNDFFNDLLN